MGKGIFFLKGRDSRRWLPGCKWLALSKWKTGTGDQDWRIFCLFILVIDNPSYLDISACKRDFKHGHPADAGGQRVQGLIFQDKISNHFEQCVFRSKIFPKVSHVRNYKMQMRMGIHSGWRHLLAITQHLFKTPDQLIRLEGKKRNRMWDHYCRNTLREPVKYYLAVFSPQIRQKFSAKNISRKGGLAKFCPPKTISIYF